MPKKTKELLTKKPISKNTKTLDKSTKKAVPSTKKPKKTKPVVKEKITKTTKKIVKSKKQVLNIQEYYDLPYRYNNTIIKILAQTPNMLFIYWDVSDDDIKKLKKSFNDNFLNNTYPVLLIHNKTKNYSYEITIDDFTNSWYLPITDPKCDYLVELGRRFKNNSTNEYIYITTSNILEVPNNCVLCNISNTVLYKNINTNNIISKNISNNIIKEKHKNNNYIYDIYKQFYKEAPTLQNPSSHSYL